MKKINIEAIHAKDTVLANAVMKAGLVVKTADAELRAAAAIQAAKLQTAEGALAACFEAKAQNWAEYVLMCRLELAKSVALRPTRPGPYKVDSVGIVEGDRFTIDRKFRVYQVKRYQNQYQLVAEDGNLPLVPDAQLVKWAAINYVAKVTEEATPA